MTHAPSTHAIAGALTTLGYTVRKQTRDGSLDTRDPHGHRAKLHPPTLLSQLPTAADPGANPITLAAEIAQALDLPIPDDLLDDPAHLKHLLRPRLIDPTTLHGRNKAAVRRDAFAGFVDVVAIGSNPQARLVRTRELDAWNATFEDTLLTATTQLAAHITPDCAHKVQDAKDLYAVVHPSEHTAPAYRLLPDLIPAINPKDGALFALPARRTLLCLPVAPHLGLEALAGIVQTAFILDRTESPNRGAIHWLQNDAVRTLPMTRIDDQGELRVHLDPDDTVKDLLVKLGEDPDQLTRPDTDDPDPDRHDTDERPF